MAETNRATSSVLNNESCCIVSSHIDSDASDESISCSHSQDTIEYQMNDDMLNVAVKTSSFYTTATTTMITEHKELNQVNSSKGKGKKETSHQQALINSTAHYPTPTSDDDESDESVSVEVPRHRLHQVVNNLYNKRKRCYQQVIMSTTESSSDESDENISVQKVKNKYKRIRKDCPVPGCGSRQLVKLADHLHYVHNYKDKPTRQKWLNKAKQDVRFSQPTLSNCQLHLNEATSIQSANSSTASSFCDGPSTSSHSHYLHATSGENCIFSLGRFKEYLEGIAGGNRSSETATSIVHDLQVFFQTVTPKEMSYKIKLLLNHKNLEMYYRHLKNNKKYKATTNAEKLRRLRMAIRFIIHEQHEDQSLYFKGCQYIDLLKQWVSSLSKPISLQRQKHSLSVIQKLPTVNSPLEFLENPNVIKKLNQAIASLQVSFDIKDIKLLTAFAAALLLYTNCQRSGVVQNLTIKEFNMRQKTHDSKVIISCINHKTGPQGRAQLVVEKHSEQILLNYMKLIREHLQPAKGCQMLFFITHNGKKYTQVYRKIKEAIILNGLKDVIPPPPSMYRIVVSTEAARHLNDSTLRIVARHLSHSEATSRQYYEFSNSNDATEAHETIQRLAKSRFA